MPKNIALINIDGHLAENGKFNNNLEEQLENFDEVILFTDRSIFKSLKQSPEKSSFFVCDFVENLSQTLKKPVRVFTTVDQYFGNPCTYYQETLKNFELKLKTEQKKNPAQFDKQESILELKEAEIKRIRKKSTSKQKDNKNGIANIYKYTIVGQYTFLANYLRISSSETINLSYFDDNLDNLESVTREHGLPIQPQCILVGASYLLLLELYQTIYGDRLNTTDKDFKKKVSHVQKINNGINRLSLYHDMREAEREQSKSEYGSTWAAWFKPKSISASIKLSAAEKAIRILKNEPYVDINDKEIKALSKGRLREEIGDELLQIVINYRNQDLQRGLIN